MFNYYIHNLLHFSICMSNKDNNLNIIHATINLTIILLKYKTITKTNAFDKNK